MHTQLFRILSKVRGVLTHSCIYSLQMPKGALLHAHLDATVKARVLLKLAIEQPAMHVRAATRITANNLKATLPEFKALPRDRWSSLASSTEDSYVPNEYVPLQQARQNFDPSLGGSEAFDDWVVGALKINTSQAYGTHNTIAKITFLPHSISIDKPLTLRRFGRNSPVPSWSTGQASYPFLRK